MPTPYHAKYFAHELTRHRQTEGVDRISMALFDACVDLNPHQIEAALFALRNPISKGVLLADEVGLGKTIEGGLILCQHWAERKRRLIVICPASLRKQWALELEEKFNLPSKILDSKTYKKILKEGNPQPFDQKAVVITSFNYASRMKADLRAVAFDLCVIDEAHKLRNCYRPSNKTGQNLKWALEDRKKCLLTATPLQNSLLELYGLTSLIDDLIFGDVNSFRTQYTSVGANLEQLRDRLKSFCNRTLRKDVLEYIKYTKRRPMTIRFRPNDDEQKLYESVSEFIARDETFAIPSRQKHLVALILRKLLASSSHAIANTLEGMKGRLENLRDNPAVDEDPDFEELFDEDDMEESYLDDILGFKEDEEDANAPNLQLLGAEIDELGRFSQWARSIGVDTKSRSLLKALDTGFSEIEKMGANRKALIFTESRRTQDYVKNFLETNGFAGKIVLFNGTNNTSESRQILNDWIENNQEAGRVTGSRPVDIRTALVEHFRDTAEIMIATEAAAEGINLQFCSLVVNYDLPWNPQRIEQRIGRCHRYGQKHDVVVINFLNERNEADQRVHELLTEKFNLFNGVFGASDEVLGQIESGVDFERRIFDIYQKCRTTDEIEEGFASLQKEMETKIETKMQDTRQLLLDYFDEDVHSKLKIQLEDTKASLDRIGKMFWSLTKQSLHEHARFDDQDFSFDLQSSPAPSHRPGLYHLISKKRENVPGEFLYRLSHPLGEWAIAEGKNADTPVAHLKFDITNYPNRIAIVEQLKGKSGWMTLQYLQVRSFDEEEYLLFSAFDDDGRSIDQESCEKMFQCDAAIELQSQELTQATNLSSRLEAESQQHCNATLASSLESNNQHFSENREQLEKWAEDMVLAAEKDLNDTKQQIKTVRRQSRLASTLDEQNELQNKLKELEKRQRKQRQRIFEVEDEIADKRDELIEALHRRMQQSSESKKLFTVRWSVV